MDRLYIISDSIKNGESFGTLLGLNNTQFKVITNVDETKEIPSKVLFINDNHHPLTSVAINAAFRSKGGLELVDELTLNKFLDNILDKIYYVDSTYGNGDDMKVKMGVKKLKDLIEQNGITPSNGFDMNYMYNLQGRYFYLVPQSSVSKVLVSLIKGRIYNNKVHMSRKISGMDINDPNRVFNNRSIKYNW